MCGGCSTGFLTGATNGGLAESSISDIDDSALALEIVSPTSLFAILSINGLTVARWIESLGLEMIALALRSCLLPEKGLIEDFWNLMDSCFGWIDARLTDVVVSRTF